MVFETERPSLLAALDLAAQRDWDEQVWRFSESISEFAYAASLP